MELIPFIQRSDLLSMMTTCSLSVYPVFRDLGSMSVLEARHDAFAEKLVWAYNPK